MNITKALDITYKAVVIGSALAKVAVIGLLAYGVNKKYKPADTEANNSDNSNN
jgi:hypothetical protein